RRIRHQCRTPRQSRSASPPTPTGTSATPVDLSADDDPAFRRHDNPPTEEADSASMRFPVRAFAGLPEPVPRAGRGRSGGVATRSTREALLEQGALLFARHGVTGVSIKALHEAIGARNESALHYHFGSRRGLLAEIRRVHLDAVERRRAVLADEIEATGRTADLRALVHALAAPMAVDLHDPVGRAHLRLVAQLSHPSLAYDDAFRSAREVDVDAAAGARVVRWLHAALPPLPSPVRRERLADLRGHLLSSFGLR